MTHVTGAYFSPTGGTKRALEAVCSLFEGEAELLELTGPSKKEKQFTPEDLLVLALPVYAGQHPAVPGLLDGLKGNNTPCVILATYGNRHYDDALAQMKREMGERGFRCVGAAAVITPHIFAPTLGVGRPDEEDMEALNAFVQGVKEKLSQPGWTEAEVPGNPSPAPKPAVPGTGTSAWGAASALRCAPPGPWTPRPCCGPTTSASAACPAWPTARWEPWATTPPRWPPGSPSSTPPAGRWRPFCNPT